MILDNLKDIKSKNILVIGDIILDKYYVGKSMRISPEAPVPILLEKEVKNVLGGAANVALNLAVANQNVTLLGVVGNDNAGSEIKSILCDKKINTKLIFTDSERCTIVKNRFIGQNNMQMFRLDQESFEEIDKKVLDNILKIYKDNVKDYDLIIISDYNKGFLTTYNTPKFIDIAKKNNINVLVDVKEPKYEKYKNAFILKPNLSELSDITKMVIKNEADILKASIELKKNTSCEYVLVTRGADGMSLLENGNLINFKCASREVYDVTGAGDTVISYLAVGLLNDLNLHDSIELSNYAAGVKVSKMGTYAVKLSDIYDYLGNDDYNKKIVSISELKDILKNNTKSIVFTNGCFDIFHVGHLRYLKETSKYADLMIIGLNSDSSIKKLKGENRPIVNENERAELLAALDFVDYVVLFDDETPYDLVKIVKPDVFTKGGDYKPEQIAGAEFAKKVVIIPLVQGKSTTNIIDKILEVYHE